MRYQCDACGCYLDPGEGLLCDECQEKMRHRVKAVKKIQEAVQEVESGQYEIILQEAM